mmetsp:Transcript_52218/g.93174  ORF Transcript_52218/g.93174 Transcript_52218/m.93174 type:complete len:276 (+) Transcript_52218:6134-6961(+)
MNAGGLRRAADSGNGEVVHGSSQVVDKHGLSSPLRANEEEWLALLNPRFDHVQVTLCINGHDHLRLEHAIDIEFPAIAVGIKGRSHDIRVHVGVQWAGGVHRFFPGQFVHVTGKALSLRGLKVAPEPPDETQGELLLCLRRRNVCKTGLDEGHQRGLDHQRIGGPQLVDGFVKIVANPFSKVMLQILCLLPKPGADGCIRVHILLGKVDHGHTADRGRRSKSQGVGLEHKIDVVAKLDPLSVGHGQQPVVIQDGVEGLDPLGVDISVAHNPGPCL